MPQRTSETESDLRAETRIRISLPYHHRRTVFTSVSYHYHHFLENQTYPRNGYNYSFAFLSALLIAKKPHTPSPTTATASMTMTITIHHSRLYPTMSTFMELLLTTV